ncbi:MAG: hypothetical protein AB1710_02880 [Pseudomonadota bacterium]|jgi:hypothetical protein
MNSLRAGTPITVADATVVPVERLSIHSYSQGKACWLYAEKTAVAIVICVAGGARAVGASGEEFLLDDLIGTVPGLAAALEHIRNL